MISDFNFFINLQEQEVNENLCGYMSTDGNNNDIYTGHTRYIIVCLSTGIKGFTVMVQYWLSSGIKPLQLLVATQRGVKMAFYQMHRGGLDHKQVSKTSLTLTLP